MDSSVDQFEDITSSITLIRKELALAHFVVLICGAKLLLGLGQVVRPMRISFQNYVFKWLIDRVQKLVLKKFRDFKERQKGQEA